MKRRVLTGLAVSVASLGLTLAGLEAVIRLGIFTRAPFRATDIKVQSTASMKEPDLREPRSEIRPKNEDFRILVVGDSFAWGAGVYPEDSYPYRIERRLNARFEGDRIEVVNWSHRGWSTWHELRSLRAAIDGLEADLLVLGFVLNDPEPSDRASRERGWAEVLPQTPAPGPSAFLHRHSHLYRLVWTRLENTRVRRAVIDYHHRLFEGETWRDCLWALRRLRSLAAKRSIPMLLVIFPLFESQIDDDYPYSDLHARMRATADELGIPALDLLETYRGVDARRLALVPYSDAHPSELAHRLAADAIVDRLVGERLVPVSGEWVRTASVPRGAG